MCTTFCFNIKSSLLKLLCILTHICEVNPLQLLPIKFLSHPRSTFLIAIFYRHDNIIRGKSQRPSARSAFKQPTTAASRPYPPIKYNPTK